MKRSEPHSGQRRNASAGLFAASEAATSRDSSALSTLVPLAATAKADTELIRLRAEALGTRQVQPQPEQVRRYSGGCQGKRMR